MSNRIFLVPQYMKSFSCIGSTCEDTCCAGWRVTLDEETYKKYNRVRHPELTVRFRTYLKRTRSKATINNYASIKMLPDQTCPFMNSNKLCDIQMNLDESYLSRTCSIYPRVYNHVGEYVEQSGTLSCPEIARLALLNPDGITFEEVLEEQNERVFYSKHIDTAVSEHYLWDLRSFTIDVLQHRAYSLEERLMFLGLFYQKVQELWNNSQLKALPDLISSYSNMLESINISELFADVPYQHSFQVNLLKQLIDYRLSTGGWSTRYLECYGQCLSGLEYTEDAPLEEVLNRYKEAHMNYYKPYIEEKEYILENYLVNHVFSKVFPGVGSNVLEEYSMLIVRYSLIKMHLIGMARYHKEHFSEKHVVQLIQSFVRAVEHNDQYLSAISNKLREHGYSTLAYMLMLLKN